MGVEKIVLKDFDPKGKERVRGSCGQELRSRIGSSMAQMVKNLPASWETQVSSLGQEDPLEKGMATDSTCLENSMDREVWWAPVHGFAELDMFERLSLHLRFVKMRERLKLGYMIKEREPVGRERLMVRRTEGDYVKEEGPWEL